MPDNFAIKQKRFPIPPESGLTGMIPIPKESQKVIPISYPLPEGLDLPGEFSTFQLTDILHGAVLLADSATLHVHPTSNGTTHFLGRTLDESILTYLYKNATIEQFHVVDQLAQWLDMHKAQIPFFYKDKFELIVSGIKIQHADGHWVSLHAHVIPYHGSKKPTATFCITLREITYLLDSRDVWARLSFGGLEKTAFAWHSSYEIQKNKDLLSDREKQILFLIRQQKTDQEIGDLLYISKHTVHQHRKNMIARLGVVDSTALIELALLTRLLN
ncbi:response regulator transcription factor [Arundinibacter roseus]|uniref:LuxR family transcriptional regulator n=1 Tax=Arundinibacter roseus TaxID=2070510 RepID=A0A4R4KLN8_9BACT|nr:helix-turn-helix transcriptional regulator [Arundinibacter roseus]TDB69198.1 LuxR family transcriptional regulator [Arundinibacter roseus]